MKQKTTIDPISTDRSFDARPILTLGNIDYVDRRETQQVLQTDDWFNPVNLQFKAEHFTIQFPPIPEQWIGFPTKTVSGVISENENRDWKRQETTPLPAETQSRIHIEKELAEIRKEVKETCEVDSEVSPIPEPAYNQTISLLERMPRNIPVPDIMWLERGGIGLQWNPENSIVTMSLYGDNHVNYVAILGKQYEIAVTCPLSDQLLLPDFLKTLSTLFQKRT